MSVNFDPRGEIFVGGQWIDITSKIQLDGGNGITVNRGTTGISSSVDPTVCMFMLDNTSGDFSPDNPYGPWYGQIGYNTPFRYSQPGFETVLLLDGSAGSYASTPHASAVNITGDLDIRIELDADLASSSKQRILAQKWSSTASEQAWQWSVTGDGQVAFTWVNAAGTSHTSTAELARLPGRALRFTLDVDNGNGTYTVAFSSADNIDGPWNVGFTGDGTTTTSIRSTSSSAVSVGGDDTADGFSSQPGRIRWFLLLSGIDGTPALDTPFLEQIAGVPSFTDTTGRTWTLAGSAALDDRDYRFNGTVPNWPVQWNVDWVWASVSAGGTLRQLAQGQRPVKSALAQRVPRFRPLAYWPCEDRPNSSRASSPVPGVLPMTAGGLTFGADTSLVSSDALPVLGSTSQLSGAVPYSSTSVWSVWWMYHVETLTSTYRTIMSISTTGTIAQWNVQMASTDPGTVQVLFRDSSGGTVFSGVIPTTKAQTYGGWFRAYLYAYQSGSDVAWNMSWAPVGGESLILGSDITISGQTLGRVTRVGSPPGGFSSDLSGMAMGHISVWDEINSGAYTATYGSTLAYAANAFDGELASSRILRLGIETATPLRTVGPPQDDQLVGYQTRNTVLGEMQTAEKADDGLLIDDRLLPCLVYLNKSQLYNREPTVLSYGMLQPGLTPTRDESRWANAFVASRDGGSSGSYELDDGSAMSTTVLGYYESSDTYSLHTDDQADQRASWEVAKGTVDAPRYPAVTIEMAKWPDYLEDVQALDVGSRMAITDAPAGKTPPGTLDLLVRGYTERASKQTYSFTFNCLPYAPWEIGVLDDDVLGRADTSGSELAADIDASDTSFTVTVTAGPLWITSALNLGEFPFDITCGGEVMTVTGLSGTSSPQTFFVTRGTNGVTKSHPAGTAITLTYPMIAGL
ncbi:hypothetical protein VSR01_10785 [Actinacidiphila sp. DG2A-62]|uniref:hypothetical protein n=1 Tax=Actinacidiphila sp. DG2A-62 TaxID=3108821 RepID=UPI002DBB16FA|nr:hypothetical protein [Actinacidiphila sp. DG2A-62]MEC3994004.1 hypothetical protein [Actinacidiphila sp. DG2A-62]